MILGKPVSLLISSYIYTKPGACYWDRSKYCLYCEDLGQVFLSLSSIHRYQSNSTDSLHIQFWLQSASCTCETCGITILSVRSHTEVNGRWQNSQSHLSQTPKPVWLPFEIYNYVQPGSQCTKFGMNQFIHYIRMHACGFSCWHLSPVSSSGPYFWDTFNA